MGSSEDIKSPKSEKSSPALEQGQQNNNAHVYPDWAAMQACYGPRLSVPPYYNPAVAPASAHLPPPFMWGPPQAMVPPYGNPYAAFYAPGGVYAHPGVPLNAHPNGHVVSPPAAVTEATAGVPLSIDAPVKPAKVNTDQGLINKLKGFDGLAMSLGTGNGGSASAADNGFSQSEDTEGSSDGSDGNTTTVRKVNKRSREGTPDDTRGRKSVTPKSTVHSGDAKAKHVFVAPGSDTDKSTGDVFTPRMTTALELTNSSGGNLKAGHSGDGSLQNERELKREKRKQSNRESARRSRMRKQAEAEDLTKKVHALDSENLALKSEMSKLTDNCAKLRAHNAAMLEKLKMARIGSLQPVGTANLLSRVNNSGSTEEGEAYESSGSRATNLRQLLDASPRADAVAAR